MALVDNIVAYWKLDEASGTREDSTANNNDLADINTVLSATGIISNAADFEASASEYLAIVNASQTGLNITGSFSISVWFKMESNPANDSSYQLVNRLQASDGYRLAIFRTAGGTNQIRRGIYNAGTSYNTDVTTTLNTATWYHFVWTYDATTNASKLYKDGNTTPISDVTSTVDPAAVSSDLRLGSNAESAGQYMDGLIDEVGIWSRALTSSEVAELYASGAGLTYPFSGASLVPSMATLGVGA